MTNIHKNIMILDSKFKMKAPHPFNHYNLTCYSIKLK